jgi:hypothetical protein
LIAEEMLNSQDHVESLKKLLTDEDAKHSVVKWWKNDDSPVRTGSLSAFIEQNLREP